MSDEIDQKIKLGQNTWFFLRFFRLEYRFWTLNIRIKTLDIRVWTLDIRVWTLGQPVVTMQPMCLMT